MNSRPLTVLAAAVAGVMALAAGPSQAQLMQPTPPQGAAPAATPLPPAAAADWRTVSPENLLVIDTTKGRVLVELEPRVAPQSVERIRTLANRGFYDGLKFHRVIRGFMAQTGDPQGTGAGGSDLPNVPGEFSFRRGRADRLRRGAQCLDQRHPRHPRLPADPDPAGRPDVRHRRHEGGRGRPVLPGVAGMARSGDPDSANSQFYLMMGSNANLNGNYTTFGRVVSGLDVVKALNAGAMHPTALSPIRT
jgi:cyclophilin family peptidyl-prolyl cis-trans isomerase